MKDDPDMLVWISLVSAIRVSDSRVSALRVSAIKVDIKPDPPCLGRLNEWPSR